MADFVGRLVDVGVALVVDVRLNPVSRQPGWSRRPLSAELEAAGIEYRHESTLGNPGYNRASFRKGDGEEGRWRMREILGCRSQSALDRIWEESWAKHIVVLCVERDAAQCHRQVVTEMVQEIDSAVEVLDLF